MSQLHFHAPQLHSPEFCLLIIFFSMLNDRRARGINCRTAFKKQASALPEMLIVIFTTLWQERASAWFSFAIFDDSTKKTQPNNATSLETPTKEKSDL